MTSIEFIFLGTVLYWLGGYLAHGKIKEEFPVEDKTESEVAHNATLKLMAALWPAYLLFCVLDFFRTLPLRFRFWSLKRSIIKVQKRYGHLITIDEALLNAKFDPAGIQTLIDGRDNFIEQIRKLDEEINK